MIPNVEKIVSDHIRDTVAIRVVGKPPSSKTDSWVQVIQIDASQTDQADHLVNFIIQLDCYASEDGGQPECVQIAREVRASLVQLNGTTSDGVITDVRMFGDIRLPDYDMEPPRDRRILTARVWAHS